MSASSDSNSDGASSTIQSCSLCSKPFTNQSSYNRHLTYCRRSLNRPKKRGQSCRTCSRAKAKCSFHARCSRCVSKGLECVYERRGGTPKEPAGTQIVGRPSPSIEPLSVEDLSMLDFGDNALLDLDLSGDLQFNQVPNWWNAQSSPLRNELLVSQPGIPCSPVISKSNYFDIEKFIESHVKSNNVGTMAHLRRANPVAQQNATLMMQSLRAFPQGMLRRETFPPFIHPRLFSDSLPEPLSICMRLAHIFVSRTPDIGPFLWRTIKAEQLRVLADVDKMSKHDLLAAIQAQMIYVIMRIIDGSNEPVEWNCDMLVIGGVLCERFQEITDEPFCPGEQSVPMCWEDWIFNESRRRTSCVWFLLGCVVSMQTGLNCEVAQKFLMLPLPSSKVQWEANSQSAWENGVDFNCNNIWMLGGLLDAHKHVTEPSSCELLDSWNARADKLGLLMNLATTLM